MRVTLAQPQRRWFGGRTRGAGTWGRRTAPSSAAPETAPCGSDDGVFGSDNVERGNAEARELEAPTKSDAHWEEQGLEIIIVDRGSAECDDSVLPTPAELNDLFERVNFPRRSEERWRTALQHTHVLVLVRATRKSRWASLGETLAFARATSDAVFNATVWDVVVTPSWQSIGLGRAVMERLVAHLLAQEITNISLYAEPRVIRLYEKLGFELDPAGSKGMAFRGGGLSARRA